MTGPGMVLSSPDTLGRKATTMNVAPMQYPTVREATPVICVNEMMPALMMFGTAPVMPASRLAMPPPERRPLDLPEVYGPVVTP